jgi:hypothetical protein
MIAVYLFVLLVALLAIFIATVRFFTNGEFSPNAFGELAIVLLAAMFVGMVSTMSLYAYLLLN